MAKVRANPKFHLEKSDGTPASGWKIYTYIAGTSTEKDTYTDNTEATPNTNPVILDANGNADIWWAGTYKVVVKDDTDVTQWTVDNYGEGEATAQVGNYNLAINGSFETDVITSGEPDNWTIVDYTDGVHSLDATDQNHGLNSLKFTSIGTGGGYATSDYFEVRESKKISVSWVMKSTVAGVRNVVDILWYTSAKTLISTTNLYDDSTTNPTSWTEKTGIATPPSTSRYAQIRVYGCHSSDATAGSTWYDDIEVTPNLADRDLANTFSEIQTFSSTQVLSKGADIASAAALTPGTDGNYFDVTGTTTITSIATLGIGTVIRLHFDASLTLTHHATDLILPGGANITTYAGDEAEFVEYASGDWRCTNYTTADGKLFVSENNLEYVAASDTITVPKYVTSAKILLVGGGGGGGGGGDGGTANGTNGTAGTQSTITHGTTVLRAGGGALGVAGTTAGAGTASGANTAVSSDISGTTMGTTVGIYEQGDAGSGTANPDPSGDGGSGPYCFGGKGSATADGVVGLSGGGGAGGYGTDQAGGGGGGSGSAITATLTVAAGDSLVVSIGAGGTGGAGTPGEGAGGDGGDGYAVISWGI